MLKAALVVNIIKAGGRKLLGLNDAGTSSQGFNELLKSIKVAKGLLKQLNIEIDRKIITAKKIVLKNFF